MGRACDMCRDTYWKLTADNEAGCEGIQLKSIRKKVSEQQMLLGKYYLFNPLTPKCHWLFSFKLLSAIQFI